MGTKEYLETLSKEQLVEFGVNQVLNATAQGAELRQLRENAKPARAQARFLIDGYVPFDGDIVYFGMGGRSETGRYPRSLAVVVYNEEQDVWSIQSVASEAAWRLNPERAKEALKRHQANIAIQHGLRPI